MGKMMVIYNKFERLRKISVVENKQEPTPFFVHFTETTLMLLLLILQEKK